MAKEELNYGKNMLLVKGSWKSAADGQTHDTFKMLPVSLDCPYVEVIYDPGLTLMVVVSKINKDNYQMAVKLDGDGHPTKAKKPHADGNPYRQMRERITVKQEFYIIERDEQIEFVKQFAVNDKFPFEKYMRDIEKESKAIVKPESKGLVDDKGMKITK